MRGTSKSRNAPLAVMVGILFLGGANAQARVDINPFVSAQIHYDSNVFRFAGDESLGGTPKRDDRVRSGTVGVMSQATFRQHQANVRASLARHNYEYFDFLDNDSRDIYADVGGEFGFDWGYKVNYQHTNQLIDYTEASTNFTLRNELNRDVYAVGMRYRLLPHTSYHLDFQNTRQRYSDSAYYYSNVDTYRVETALSYQRSEATQLRLFLHTVADDFPDRTISANSVLDDSQLSFVAGTDVNLALSGDFTVSSRLGVKTRRHDNATARDYVGFIYKLENRWQISGKNRLVLLLSRDAPPVELVQANYAIVDEFGLRSTWAMRHNTDIAFSATQRWYDFYDRNDITRRDRTFTIFASVVYVPNKYVNLTADGGQERRVSDVASNSFAVNTMRITLRFTL